MRPEFPFDINDLPEAEAPTCRMIRAAAYEDPTIEMTVDDFIQLLPPDDVARLIAAGYLQ